MGDLSRATLAWVVLALALSAVSGTQQDKPVNGRSLLKTASVASSYVSLGNPDAQYTGAGQNIYVGNNDGLQVGTTMGTTANLNGVSAVGTFASTEGSQGKTPDGPGYNGEVGVVMSGQPIGVHMTSSSLFPSITTNPKHAAVDYGAVNSAPTPRRRLRNAIGLGDPTQDYVGIGVDVNQGSVSQGFTINQNGASVLGEFASISGPERAEMQIGYVANAQPLGIKIAFPTASEGTLPTAAVVTGIKNPAVNYGDINPGRKLSQLPDLNEAVANLPKLTGLSAEDLSKLPEELPLTPAVADWSLPAGFGLPNGLRLTNAINILPGEGTLKGRAVGVSESGLADMSGDPTAATAGAFRSVAISQASAEALPVLTVNAGLTMNGQPYGVKLASDNPLPLPSKGAATSGRRLHQLTGATKEVGGLGVEMPQLPEELPVIPTVADFSLPAGLGLPNGLHVADKINVVPGEGALKGHAVGLTGAGIADLSGDAKTATVGNYQSVEISQETPKSVPVVTVDAGVTVSGQPYGVKASSDNPVPQASKGSTMAPGRRLQQVPQQLPGDFQLTNPLTLGISDNSGNYLGTSADIINIEGKAGNAVAYNGGSTLNLAAAPGNTQVVGEFHSLKVASSSGDAAPVVSAQVGTVLAGQPYGIGISTANPIPQTVSTVEHATVPFSGMPEVGRKLHQVGQPVVVGLGDPTTNFIGTGNGVIPAADGATYTGGETVNLASAPSGQLAGNFRNVKVGMDQATGLPYVKGQVGTVVGGQPQGLGFSSNLPLPSPVDTISNPAVPYAGVKDGAAITPSGTGHRRLSEGSATPSVPSAASVAKAEAFTAMEDAARETSPGAGGAPGRRRLTQTAANPVVIGVGNPAGDFIGEGNGVTIEGNTVTYSGGITVNRDGAPTDIGDFRTVQTTTDPASPLPTVSGSAGAVVGGQVVGLGASTANPIPGPVSSIKASAVPYKTISPDFTGRKLSQSITPSSLVVGLGDPAGAYIGEGNSISQDAAGVTYTGGLTANSGAGPTLVGDFRTVEISADPANLLPTIGGSAGAIVGGQLLGVKASTANPIPVAVDAIKGASVPYKTVAGRKLLQGAPNPIVIGLGNPDSNYLASGNALLTNGDAPNGFSGGATLNTPKDGTALGDWRAIKVTNDPTTGAPVATAEYGVIVLGEPRGVSVSTAGLPKLVDQVGDAALEYRPNPGRKLQQQLPPIVVGVGNPNGTYFGTGFSLVPGTGAEAGIPAGLTGGTTINLSGEAVGPILGEFRSAQVKSDEGTGLPVVKAQMGVILAGQPIGIEITSSGLPKIITSVTDPAVPYNFADTASGGRRLLDVAQALGRRLLQPSVGGGYFSVGDPKKGNYQGVGVDAYAGQNRDKGNAIGVATGFANNTNGKTATGMFSDSYVSDKTTMEQPVAGEVGIVFDGWKIGLKQNPGDKNPGLTLGVTRPVVPYNGDRVPDYSRNTGPRDTTGAPAPPAPDSGSASPSGSSSGGNNDGNADGKTTPSSPSTSGGGSTDGNSGSSSPGSDPTSSPAGPSLPASPAPDTSTSSPASDTSTSSPAPDAPSGPAAGGSPPAGPDASPSPASAGGSMASPWSPLVSSGSSSNAVEIPAIRDVPDMPGIVGNAHPGTDVSVSAFPG